MSKLFSGANALNLMLVFVPIGIALELVHANPVMIFGASCLAIIPLAGLMGKATEHLAESLGEGVGGLLNATFGNAAELIIALMALKAGLHGVVKASITGSIIGNVLLVFGVSALAGGLKFKEQKFNQTAAGVGSTLLALSVIGLVLPAAYHYVAIGRGPAVGQVVVVEQELSLEIAIVLIITYGLSLLFSLKTHAHLYVGGHADDADEAMGTTHWSKGSALTVLLTATVFVGVMSEFLVGAVEHTAEKLGLTEVFVGVILVAIIGNAAEHSTAVLMALKNKMDLAVNIAVGSSIQVALFVAPVLVFASFAVGPRPMNLLFTPFEVIAIAVAVTVIVLVSQDGLSNWLEGVMLLAVYVMLGIAFYFLPG